MRTHIAKALQTRSRAIGTALANYNRLAKTLDPPCADLNFQEVLLYSSLAEFDLLRDTRNTVRSRVWAQPAYQIAMACHYKVRCTRIELKRANTEIMRLHTFIRNDTALHLMTIDSLCTTDHGLSVVLEHKWKLRSAVNQIHLMRLNAIADLPGYTGSHVCGTRVGSVVVAHEEGNPRGRGSDSDDDDDIDNDLFQDTLNMLTDFVATMDLIA